MPELTDYHYEVLMVRPDYLEANPKIATAVARAISRGGALFRSNPEAAKAALRNHRLYTKDKLADDVFDLSFNMVVNAMPAWGDMSSDGWQKVLTSLAARASSKIHPRRPPPRKACSGPTNTSASRSPFVHRATRGEMGRIQAQ